MLPYLLAGLPTPRLGEAPEMGMDAFLDACGRFLSEDRVRELAAAAGRDVPPVAGRPSAAARAWAELAARVEDRVVRARCARDGRDPAPYLRGPPGVRLDVDEAVAEAFATPHPAARARALDELRWRLADELGRADPAGFAALVARAVQLGIAWRWADWDAEAGWVVLEAHLRRLEPDAVPAAGEAADG
jgi:hypothetical protein